VEDDPLLFEYRFGHVVFDEAEGSLLVHGRAQEMEPLPLLVLSLLLRSGGQLVSRRTLRAHVGAGITAGDLVIEATVRKLRAALGEDAEGLILMRGQGYAFNFQHGEGVLATPVAVRAAQVLALAPGQPVPGREEFVLYRRLPLPGPEAWVARQAVSGELRVFKLALDTASLTALLTEAHTARQLLRRLPGRTDFLHLRSSNFSAHPCHLEYDYGGEHLSAWIAGGGRLEQLPAAEVVDLMIRIAEPIQALHSIGVVHADLRPESILMQRIQGNWHVRLADFGGSRLQDPVPAGSTPAHHHTVPRSPQGPAPRPQDDLYALGLLLFRLKTADLHARLDPGWEQRVGDLLLCADIRKATHSNPDARFSSVEELIASLRQLPARREKQARQERLRTGMVRARWAAVALFIGLGVLAGGWALLKARRSAQDSTHALAAVLRQLDRTAPGPHACTAGIMRDAFRDDPLTRAWLDGSLAKLCYGRGEYAAAEDLGAEAARLLEMKVGQDDARTLAAELMLVRTLDMRRRPDLAGSLLALVSQHMGTHTSDHIAMMARWAEAGHELVLMHPAAALPLYEEADAIRARVLPQDPQWLFRIKPNIAWCHVRLGHDQKVLSLLSGLIDLSSYPPDAVGLIDWIKARTEYAKALSNLGRSREAVAILEVTVREAESDLGAKSYDTGLVWQYIESVQEAQGHYHEALTAERHAELTTRGRGQQLEGTVLGTIGWLEYLTGEPERALGELRTARSLLAQELGPKDAAMQLIDFYLAAVEADTGHAEDAGRRAMRLDPEPLTTAAISGHWKERLAALRALILIRRNLLPQGIGQLQAVLTSLEKDGASAADLEPLRGRLTEPPSSGGTPLLAGLFKALDTHPAATR
jgi:non-specific serine/threonine protein kinase